MSAYYKPRVFRSEDGCCICKVKQSTSRFCDSKIFEEWFKECFDLTELRCGEMCYACVLVVKRWGKAKVKNDLGPTKNYSRLVDSRMKGRTLQSLTGTLKKRKKLANKTQNENESPLERIKKKKIFDKKIGSSKRKQTNPKKRQPLIPSDDLLSIVDETYWTKEKTCATKLQKYDIYKGPNGETEYELNEEQAKEKVCHTFIYRGPDGDALIDNRIIYRRIDKNGIQYLGCYKCKISPPLFSKHSSDQDLLNPHGTVFTYHDNPSTTYSLMD